MFLSDGGKNKQTLKLKTTQIVIILYGTNIHKMTNVQAHSLYSIGGSPSDVSEDPVM